MAEAVLCCCNSLSPLSTLEGCPYVPFLFLCLLKRTVRTEFNGASLWIPLFCQHKNTDFCYSKDCRECGRDIFLIQTNTAKDVWMSRCLWRQSLGSGIVGLDCKSISSSEPTSFLVPMVFYLLISLTVRVPFTPQTGQYYFYYFSSLSDRKIWKWWLFCRVKYICLSLMWIHF